MVLTLSGITTDVIDLPRRADAPIPVTLNPEPRLDGMVMDPVHGVQAVMVAEDPLVVYVHVFTPSSSVAAEATGATATVNPVSARLPATRSESDRRRRLTRAQSRLTVPNDPQSAEGCSLVPRDIRFAVRSSEVLAKYVM